MKEPKKKLSKFEHSALVLNVCLILGTIALAFVSIVSEVLGVIGKILLISFWAVIIIFFVCMFVIQIKEYTKDEDEKE